MAAGAFPRSRDAATPYGTLSTPRCSTVELGHHTAHPSTVYHNLAVCPHTSQSDLQIRYVPNPIPDILWRCKTLLQKSGNPLDRIVAFGETEPERDA